MVRPGDPVRAAGARSQLGPQASVHAPRALLTKGEGPITPKSNAPQEEKTAPLAPEDQPGEPGAEGGSNSDAADKLPGAPTNDDSALGDTDQHSSA